MSSVLGAAARLKGGDVAPVATGFLSKGSDTLSADLASMGSDDMQPPAPAPVRQAPVKLGPLPSLDWNSRYKSWHSEAADTTPELGMNQQGSYLKSVTLPEPSNSSPQNGQPNALTSFDW